MASRFGRRNLVCFYCNKRSGIKYDGLINRWECASCDAINYLDENGDITDPPTASTFADSPLPVERRYAIPRPDSPPVRVTDPFSSTEDSIFCTTCLKNQHLYTSSLAQYEDVDDSSSPNHKDKERQYYKYRQALEKRYPQVCEDCEPKVLEKIKDATKTAKTDYLRKILEKSRSKKTASRKITLPGIIQFTGKNLWYAGIILQLFWHIKMLALAAIYSSTVPFEFSLAPSVSAAIAKFAPINYPRLGLYISTAAVWWNPKFKQLGIGFAKHVSGFGEWYTYQAIILVFRAFVYYIMGTAFMINDPYGSASIATHMFAFVFVIYLAGASHHTIKVDMTPLWMATPERLQNVGPATRSPSSPTTMEDLLNAMTPSKKSRRPVSQDTAPVLPPHLDPIKKERFAALEAMDWAPTPTQAEPVPQYRAFQHSQTSPRSGQLFGEAPVAEQKGPFWYHVPPAPITPAQRLRNPPNQPRLRVTPTEAKGGLFQPTSKIPTLQNSKPKEVEFAQPKLFVKPKDDDLADLMGSFSLGVDQTEDLTAEGFTLKTLGRVLGAALFGGLVLIWIGVIPTPSI
ncbi:Ima1 N-terminal domain-containing protein [Bisporella sp. PMI_857]|nr:Ima1 N-terminal domain-containing protein [Bisporella sp. PMI_857]